MFLLFSRTCHTQTYATYLFTKADLHELVAQIGSIERRGITTNGTEEAGRSGSTVTRRRSSTEEAPVGSDAGRRPFPPTLHILGTAHVVVT